jgi:hypothetical protein
MAIKINLDRIPILLVWLAVLALLVFNFEYYLGVERWQALFFAVFIVTQLQNLWNGWTDSEDKEEKRLNDPKVANKKEARKEAQKKQD